MKEYIIVAIMLLPFVLGFTASGIYLLKGKGWSMISMPDRTKDKWDKLALCRFTGAFMLFMAFCFILMAISLPLGGVKLLYVALWLISGGSAIAIIKMFFPGEAQKRKQDNK